jgi:hypothetical protein
MNTWYSWLYAPGILSLIDDSHSHVHIIMHNRLLVHCHLYPISILALLLYLIHNLATVFTEPDLERKLTPKFQPLYQFFVTLTRSKNRDFVTADFYNGDELLVPMPNIARWADRNCSFVAFATTFQILGPFPHPRPDEAPDRSNKKPT